MSNVSNFTNEKFRVLAHLYDMKDKDNQVKITQTEICSDLDLSRATVNNIFKTLKENGYLIHDESRVGRYYLTEEAINVVETFRKTDKNKGV